MDDVQSELKVQTRISQKMDAHSHQQWPWNGDTNHKL